MGYELTEQLGLAGSRLDHLSGQNQGTTVIGMWKAVAEMAALGWIDPVRRPHLGGVQAAGCGPIARAFASGGDKATDWEDPHTIADGLRVPDTLGDVLVLRALRESAGAALSVGDAGDDFVDEGLRDVRRRQRLAGKRRGAPRASCARQRGRVQAERNGGRDQPAGATRYLDVLEPAR